MYIVYVHVYIIYIVCIYIDICIYLGKRITPRGRGQGERTLFRARGARQYIQYMHMCISRYVSITIQILPISISVYIYIGRRHYAQSSRCELVYICCLYIYICIYMHIFGIAHHSTRQRPGRRHSAQSQRCEHIYIYSIYISIYVRGARQQKYVVYISTYVSIRIHLGERTTPRGSSQGEGTLVLGLGLSRGGSWSLPLYRVYIDIQICIYLSRSRSRYIYLCIYIDRYIGIYSAARTQALCAELEVRAALYIQYMYMCISIYLYLSILYMYIWIYLDLDI